MHGLLHSMSNTKSALPHPAKHFFTQIIQKTQKRMLHRKSCTILLQLPQYYNNPRKTKCQVKSIEKQGEIRKSCQN